MALAAVGIAIALAVILSGCNHAPAQTTIPPPVLLPQVQINGLLTCNYQNDVLSNCALNPGATLDDLANSLLKGTAVTQ